MTCRTAGQLVYRFLDGSLSGSRREGFLAHVAQCEDCATVLRELEEVLTVLRDAAEEEPRVPTELPSRIKRAVIEAQGDACVSAAAPRPAVGSPAFVATCASLFIAAVMTYIVMTQIYMRGLDAQVEAPGAVSITTAADDALAGKSARGQRPKGTAEAAPAGAFEGDAHPHGHAAEGTPTGRAADAGSSTPKSSPTTAAAR